MFRKLVELSVDHPKTVLVFTFLLTILFAVQFPKIKIDTDPENMLESDQPDRVFYDWLKKQFGINELIVLGITDEQGVFRHETLEKVGRITDAILRIKGVISEDVISLTTTDNIVVEGDTLSIRRIMEKAPENPAEREALKRELLDNPLFLEKIVSRDGKAVAIYIPIERKDLSYKISQEIEAIVSKELGDNQRYHIAGLPVAEDTFGHEMFLQMGVTAPMAGGLIFLLLFLLFRRLSLIMAPMIVAMLSVIWTMGLLIGSGLTVHIMSSMIPIFLMPIAVLDSVHILSEFYDRYPQLTDKRAAILATFDELFTPCLYTSLTTAVGFGAQVTAGIPPVRVFGAFVAFGAMAAWVLTITFIPAWMMLLKEERLNAKLAAPGRNVSLLDRLLPPIGRFSFYRHKLVIVILLVLLGAGVAGISRTEINDNPVNWFKPHHRIRVADREMNRLFGGTYMAYLAVQGQKADDIKRPEVMHYMERLQDHLESMQVVGKTTSVADIVKRINYVLHGQEGSFDAVPGSLEEIGQYLFLFLMSGDPNELDNFVDYDYMNANIWVQLRAGENKKMEAVELSTADFIKNNPLPAGITMRWSGLTYINKTWQMIMVVGMLKAFFSSWIFVFLLMVVLFRSWRLSLVSMAPLTVSIAFAYGIVGLAGKEYDMPIAVCSSLALGLAIDYAIHFLQRYREKYAEVADAEKVNEWMFGNPARAIARNAIVIAFGFLPLLLATLTPYATVGYFFAILMASSAFATLFVLPAFMRLGERFLLGGKNVLPKKTAI